MGLSFGSGTWFVILSASPMGSCPAVECRGLDEGGTEIVANGNTMQQKGTTDGNEGVVGEAGKDGVSMMKPGFVGIGRLVAPDGFERSGNRVRTRLTDQWAAPWERTARLTVARGRHSMGGRLDDGAAQGIS